MLNEPAKRRNGKPKVKKMQEKIVNFTPHSVTVNGIEIFSTGVVRLQEKNENIGTIAGIPVVKQVRGEPEGLPEPKEGVWIIVSRPIFDSLDRKDLLAIGETIRDSDGKIIGAKNLVVK